ncbi:hypothetical protein GIB67_007343 [Kingdonia uniflora]|uniref:Uncharacterized protein n=1 Tax=Kingdonia uniflora TaxID=39325 RepID=A0A7J7NXX0_9MAGN|nr:hypothetical protein GIB67_007343 [Kingdonia uniflora]
MDRSKMVNQQPQNPSFLVPNASSLNPISYQPRNTAKPPSVEQLLLNLTKPDLRENALIAISKKKDTFPDLALLMWNSFGIIAILLQEIISIYPALSPPTLTQAASNRMCNVLGLLQCVASHSGTKIKFLNAQLPLYLYPLINTKIRSRPFENIRLTSLGVIGALVKDANTEVITFLLSTEIIPLCLHTMEMGGELSQTVATFVVQKIIVDDVGLGYICTSPDRFYALSRCLGTMVASLVHQPSARLLKNIIRCYHRLLDNPRACLALRAGLPNMLRDGFLSNCLREDELAKNLLKQLIDKISGGNQAAA